MYVPASHRFGHKKTTAVLFTLGALLFTLVVACGGVPKNTLPPRLTEVKRLAAEGSKLLVRTGMFCASRTVL